MQECSFDRWSVANLALHIGAKNAKTARRTVQASNNEGSQHGTDAVREAVCFDGGGCALIINSSCTNFSNFNSNIRDSFACK